MYNQLNLFLIVVKQLMRKMLEAEVVTTKKSSNSQDVSASEQISKKIDELGDWRGRTLGKVRELIHAADPEIVEAWKWRGTAAWSHGGFVCTGEVYKNKVKLTFSKGASLDDPDHLFNASLEGNAWRAIDIFEGDRIDDAAFMKLIQAAVALNIEGKKKS